MQFLMIHTNLPRSPRLHLMQPCVLGHLIWHYKPLFKQLNCTLEVLIFAGKGKSWWTVTNHVVNTSDMFKALIQFALRVRIQFVIEDQISCWYGCTEYTGIPELLSLLKSGFGCILVLFQDVRWEARDQVGRKWKGSNIQETSCSLHGGRFKGKLWWKFAMMDWEKKKDDTRDGKQRQEIACWWC